MLARAMVVDATANQYFSNPVCVQGLTLMLILLYLRVIQTSFMKNITSSAQLLKKFEA